MEINVFIEYESEYVWIAGPFFPLDPPWKCWVILDRELDT
jgi:hypothetical protein